MSCGNIHKAICTKATNHVWLMIAQIPIVKFEEERYQGLLSMRLYHICMEIGCRTLMQHPHQPDFFPDPSGTLRYIRPVLAGYLADLPEKLMISVQAHSQSPISELEASTKHFGDAFAHPVRHKLQFRYVVQSFPSWTVANTCTTQGFLIIMEKLHRIRKIPKRLLGVAFILGVIHEGDEASNGSHDRGGG